MNRRTSPHRASRYIPPMTTQPYTPHANAGMRPAAVLLAAAALALALAVAFAAFSCSREAGNAQSDAPGNAPELERSLVLNDVLRGEAPVRGVPAKLQGCEETVDENGIVHGVTPDGVRYTLRGRGELAGNPDKVTLAAVGDLLVTSDTLPVADAYAGESGDGLYDFNPWYAEVTPFLAQFDLRYANQETVMAGGEGGYPYAGYPSFNTPESAADAIANAGFNLINFATNHTYDYGTDGVERTHEVWARYPELLLGGSYLTEQERETVHLIERNGMTFAFLGYTYGDNNYPDPASMPNDHYSCTFDQEAMRRDIERAKTVADAVIVSMHWGTEYVNEPNDQQREYARFLADMDVDLVLGTHAHTIQPVEYVTGETGNTVPVVFGLSDFISTWTITDYILSGIFTCDFVQNDDGSVSVENLAWHPTIEWSDGAGNVRVRMLASMDEAETNANALTVDVADDYAHVRELTNSVITEIPVIWEGERAA